MGRKAMVSRNDPEVAELVSGDIQFKEIEKLARRDPKFR